MGGKAMTRIVLFVRCDCVRMSLQKRKHPSSAWEDVFETADTNGESAESRTGQHVFIPCRC